MNHLRKFSIAALLAVAALAIQGCKFSSANLSKLETFSDEAGTIPATSFKSGEKIFAKATVANNPGKVSVKFTVITEADLDSETKKGTAIMEAAYELDGDGVASFTVTPNEGFPGGPFKVNADMIDEDGQKKDSKSIDITVAAPAQ
jgi:hypothetical protein